MKRVALAVCVALALGFLSSAVAQAQGKQDFVLYNKFGQKIVELYISTTSTNEWEEDVLGVDRLDNDDHVTIHFSPEASECLYDLKVVDEEGHSTIWTKIDLCKANEVTLQVFGGKPVARIK